MTRSAVWTAATGTVHIVERGRHTLCGVLVRSHWIWSTDIGETPLIVWASVRACGKCRRVEKIRGEETQ